MTLYSPPSFTSGRRWLLAPLGRTARPQGGPGNNKVLLEGCQQIFFNPNSVLNLSKHSTSLSTCLLDEKNPLSDIAASSDFLTLYLLNSRTTNAETVPIPQQNRLIDLDMINLDVTSCNSYPSVFQSKWWSTLLTPLLNVVVSPASAHAVKCGSFSVPDGRKTSIEECNSQPDLELKSPTGMPPKAAGNMTSLISARWLELIVRLCAKLFTTPMLGVRSGVSRSLRLPRVLQEFSLCSGC